MLEPDEPRGSRPDLRGESAWLCLPGPYPITPISLHKIGSQKSFLYGTIDYKNLPLLRKFITNEGKILSRKLTGLNCKQQRKIAQAIKTSRVTGLLPFARHEVAL